MELCSMLCDRLNGGEFGGEGMHVYVWLGLFTVHLKLSQHCLLIDHTPIQNKNFKKKDVLKEFLSQMSLTTNGTSHFPRFPLGLFSHL